MRPVPFVAVAAAVILAGGLGAAAGFMVGVRWPLEALEIALGLRDPDAPSSSRGWTEVARTDLPRYEFGRIQVGDSVYLFGGFSDFTDTIGIATNRVDVLDLRTGAWSRRRDMPFLATHAHPAVLGDETWFAGGFEGNHPGAVIDAVWRYRRADDSWERGPPLPAARGGGALVALGDTLHFIGGFLPDRIGNSGDHWRLEPRAEAWKAAPPLPRPRGHVTAFVRDGRIVVMGGNYRHDVLPLDVSWVDVYDPATRSWSRGRKTPFPASHTEAATIHDATQTIVVGGRDSQHGIINRDDVLVWEAATGWVHNGHAPVGMLGGLAAVLGDTLYTGLGAPEGNVPTTRPIWKHPLRDAWWRVDRVPVRVSEVAAGEIDGVIYVVGGAARATLAYDVRTGRWKDPQSLRFRPVSGHHHAAEVIDERLYLFGGLETNGEVQIYDPGADEWLLGPPMPFAAGSSASARIGGRVYVAGGIVGDTTTALAAALDLGSMTWTPIADMPRPRNHTASGTDGRRLFVFGGRGPGSGDGNVVADGFDDVQIYDPETDRWTVSDGAAGAPTSLPQARGGMGKAVYLNGEFWIIGGETEHGSGATEAGTYARVDIYDPAADRWRRGPDLSIPRHGIFPVLAAGRIFVAGGGTRAGNSPARAVEVLWPRDVRGRP